jgi:copper chaperone CopZ
MKKTIILTIAALMTFSVSSAYAAATEVTAASSLTDKKPAKKKGELKEVTFDVHLHCENCMKKVQENISFEKGVKDLHVCLDDQTVSIKYDAAKTSEDTLKAAIEKLGYPVSGKREGGHSHSHQEHDHAHEHGHEHGHN